MAAFVDDCEVPTAHLVVSKKIFLDQNGFSIEIEQIFYLIKDLHADFFVGSDSKSSPIF